MALGSNNYQNNNQQQNGQQFTDPSYYSRLRIKNAEDGTSLAFTFWKGTLKLSINEYDIRENRVNELAYIHLSPTKARILSNGVENVMNNPESSDVYGIDTGIGETRGFIAIGREMGNPFLFISKVDRNGNYESSTKFKFNMDYNYLLKVSNLEKLKCQKEYDNTIELQQLLDVLRDYARAASGALGASFHDIGRYEVAKINSIIRRIGEKAGVVDMNRQYNNGGKSNNSFFNGANTEYSSPKQSSNDNKSTSNRYQSIDDLESELG